MWVSDGQRAAAFLTHTASGIQSSVDMVHSDYSRAGLSMNPIKTEVLAQHAGDTPPQISVNNQELPSTEKFTYLGSVVTSSCSLD